MREARSASPKANEPSTTARAPAARSNGNRLVPNAAIGNEDHAVLGEQRGRTSSRASFSRSSADSCRFLP